MSSPKTRPWPAWARVSISGNVLGLPEGAVLARETDPYGSTEEVQHCDGGAGAAQYRDRLEQHQESKVEARRQVRRLLGINLATIHNWVEAEGRREGTRAPAVARLTESEEIRALRKRVAELERASDIPRPRRFSLRRARPPTQVIVAYIDSHRERFGVEPICAVLSEHGIKMASSTYSAHRAHPVSQAALEDTAAAQAG